MIYNNNGKLNFNQPSNISLIPGSSHVVSYIYPYNFLYDINRIIQSLSQCPRLVNFRIDKNVDDKFQIYTHTDRHNA